MLSQLLENILSGNFQQSPVLRHPQIQRTMLLRFGPLLQFLIPALQQRGLLGAPSVLTGGSQPSPLESALVTSPTRPSTVADTLAPNSGVQFQPFERTPFPTDARSLAPTDVQSLFPTDARSVLPTDALLGKRLGSTKASPLFSLFTRLR